MLRYMGLSFLLIATCVGQSTTAAKTKLSPIVPTFEVRFEPDPKLSISFDESGYPAVYSSGCDSDGNPYIQVERVFPPHSSQVLKFDPNGIVTFETTKISDIVEPKQMAHFVLDARLYMLVEGDTRTERITRKLEDGKDVVDWDTKGEPRYYIAKFDPDGSYKRALKLDLPFRPIHLSGFRMGSFLISGSDANNVPKVALLDSGGQLLRYIEFPKEKQVPAEKSLSTSFGLTASSDFAAMLLSDFNSLFSYQDSVLYVRSRSGAPIYKINAGGEAQAVKIKNPEGYSVEYFLPSDRNWFVVSTEQGKFGEAKSVVYEIDPSNGQSLRRYLVEGAGHTKSISEGQSDLACFHEGEFISVRHQDGKLTVLHGTPLPAK